MMSGFVLAMTLQPSIGVLLARVQENRHTAKHADMLTWLTAYLQELTELLQQTVRRRYFSQCSDRSLLCL